MVVGSSPTRLMENKGKPSKHLARRDFSCAAHPYQTKLAVSWRCDECPAIAYPSNAAAEATIRENQTGVTLRQLSNAGDHLNLSESE